MEQTQQQQNTSVFLTKFKQLKTKTGETFFAGKLGMADVMLMKNKKTEGEWNLIIKQNTYKPEPQQNKQQDPPEFDSSAAVPF